MGERRMIDADTFGERTLDPIRSVERVTVTRVVTVEGLGAFRDNPVREVVSYFDDDGACIGRVDSWARGENKT